MKVDAKGFAGVDRLDIELPAVQQAMLEAVAKAGKPVAVVLLNGSALAMNWGSAECEGASGGVVSPGRRAGRRLRRR
jgi:beta-glucosidase